MKITFDPAKRERTLRERELDFAEAEEVFAGPTLDAADDRHDYGELRMVTIGHLRGGRVLDAVRRRPARLFDEEGQ